MAAAAPAPGSLATAAATGAGDTLALAAGLRLDDGTGAGLATGDGDALAAGDGEGTAAAAGTAFGTGWIETYRPSQTIALGAYFHGVKKRLSCAVVSYVFGAMS